MTLSLLRHLYRSHQLEWESHSRHRSERLEKLQGTRDLPSTPRRRDREALAPRGPTPAGRPMSRCSVENNNVLPASGPHIPRWLFAAVDNHLHHLAHTKNAVLCDQHARQSALTAPLETRRQ